VTNPHIKRVYDSYYSSFQLLRQMPPIRTQYDNARFCEILRRQLDQHGAFACLDQLGAHVCMPGRASPKDEERGWRDIATDCLSGTDGVALWHRG
jgi:hypothetical protein